MFRDVTPPPLKINIYMLIQNETVINQFLLMGARQSVRQNVSTPLLITNFQIEAL